MPGRLVGRSHTYWVSEGAPEGAACGAPDRYARYAPLDEDALDWTDCCSADSEEGQ